MMHFRGGPVTGLAVIAIGLSLVLAGPQAVADPTTGADQGRGKQIYLEGASTGGGAISAVVGSEGLTLPASAVPCASCHGPDGLGRPEGGVLPPDIRWSQLTKVYGHVHENGRKHPAFDEAGLAQVLASGIDPAGNRLDRAMPLYQMSEQDMSDLVAYLKFLEHDRDPGVDDDQVQVATLVPLGGAKGGLGQAMAQVMYAHFQDLNARGGIYGRQIELLAIPFGASAEVTLDTLRKALRVEGIFAVVGAYTVGLDSEILDVLRTEHVPLVGPFTLDPGDQLANAEAFYIYPGFDEQAQTLVGKALEDGGAEGGAVLVVGPDGERIDQLLAAVTDRLKGHERVEMATVRYRPGELDTTTLVERVREADIGSVFYFGRQAGLDALLVALAAAEQYPRIYLLSSFVAKPPFDAPAGFHHRIFIAYPTLASDIDEQGRAAYAELAQRHALPRDHVQAQMAALAAARLLEEGLRRAGSRLDRRALVDGIEALYAFKTGVTPPLTYGPNRRIGARGAHVVAVDLLKRSYAPLDGWRELR